MGPVKPPKEPTFRPFAVAAAKLMAALAKPAAVPRPAPAPARDPDPEPEDDEALFRRAVEGTAPLARRERVAPPKPAAPSVAPYDEEAEALAKLAAMLDGTEPLGAEFSEEHTEWIASDADASILPRLVAGDFAWQAHVDLHGMTREQAKAAVFRFLAASRIRHYRCVLVVHGRGNHSDKGSPVLKPWLQRALQRGALKTWVFAWCTARPVDGGPGAMYVMLRD
jgi:DNA-nicking Smr family endonuclease